MSPCRRWGAAIVCSRSSRRRGRGKRCSVEGCSQWAAYECDHPAPERRSRTCDKPLCERHRVSVGPDLDHCPHHQHEPAQGARGGFVLREYRDEGDHYVVTDFSRRCIVAGGGPPLPQTIVPKRGPRK